MFLTPLSLSLARLLSSARSGLLSWRPILFCGSARKKQQSHNRVLCVCTFVLEAEMQKALTVRTRTVKHESMCKHLSRQTPVINFCCLSEAQCCEKTDSMETDGFPRTSCRPDLHHIATTDHEHRLHRFLSCANRSSWLKQENGHIRGSCGSSVTTQQRAPPSHLHTCARKQHLRWWQGDRASPD